MDYTEIIDRFERETRYRLEEKDGGLYYGGYLNLRSINITSLPENLTVEGFLDLTSSDITSLPDNLTVVGSLYLYGSSITSLPDNLTVVDNLHLGWSRITSLPDNLTVGRGLYLDFSRITSLPDNLTVGGNLHLYGTSITSLPATLVVGGNIYTDEKSGIDTDRVNRNIPPILEWTRGDKKYCKAAGIFAEVISEHGNVKKVRFLDTDEDSYLVTDGNGNWSHGKTIKEAKEGLTKV